MRESKGRFVRGWSKKQVAVKCKQCGKEVVFCPSKSKGKKYCSKKCQYISKRVKTEVETNAMQLYRSGEKIDKILELCSIGNTTFFRILKRNQIKKRGQPKIQRVKRIIKNCPICGKEMSLTPYLEKTRGKYCSHKCFWKSLEGKEVFDRTGMPSPNKGEMIEVKCANCGKMIKLHPYRLKSVQNNYCSRSCAIEHKWKDSKYREHMIKAHLGQMAWNRGKTWEQLFGKQKAEELLELNRKRIIEMYKSGTFPRQTNTKIEKIIKQELLKLGFKENEDFFHQYKFDKFICDFAFPKQKLIIECQGDYWHANPAKYPYNPNKPEEDLHPIQIKGIKRDEVKETYIRKKGWLFFPIWEYNIMHRHNRKLFIDAIKDIIERKNKEIVQQAAK